MCSLMEHSERSYREEKARQAQDPKGSFLVGKTKPGRIGVDISTPKTAIYNADYAPSGVRVASFAKPWTVIGPGVFETYPTHTAAIQRATQENK
jgi:hypothetical protein